MGISEDANNVKQIRTPPLSLDQIDVYKRLPRPDGSPLHDEDVADVRLSVVSNQGPRDLVALILEFDTTLVRPLATLLPPIVFTD